MTDNTMKQAPIDPMRYAMPSSCELKINTRILLHPEAVNDPGRFALHRSVDLVGDVAPSTSFKRNRETGEKDKSVKANIHLVQHGAIRLFSQRDDVGDWIRVIEVNPGLLLHGDRNHPLTEPYLAGALSMLKTKVAPLVADPEDVRHIVPGLAGDDEHVAFWGGIQSELWFPDVTLCCLHGLGHPNIGLAEGADKKAVTVGRFGGDCVIRFERADQLVDEPEGKRKVNGICVKLSLKGRDLLSRFGRPGMTADIREKERMVRFRASDVLRVHQEIMSELVGMYLPIPPEWAGIGNDVTPAKVIALLSKLTSIPLEELRAMYDARSNPSKSKRKRLNKDVRAVAAYLKHVPVSSLFRPEVYAVQPAESSRPPHVHIDPQIAAAYGPNSTSR